MNYEYSIGHTLVFALFSLLPVARRSLSFLFFIFDRKFNPLNANKMESAKEGYLVSIFRLVYTGWLAMLHRRPPSYKTEYVKRNQHLYYRISAYIILNPTHMSHMMLSLSHHPAYKQIPTTMFIKHEILLSCHFKFVGKMENLVLAERSREGSGKNARFL